jgi:ribonuclease HI
VVNVLKVSVDGAFTAEDNSGAAGAVARDSDGNFLMAMSRKLLTVPSALAAEAKTLREGVRLVHPVTTGHVVLETGCLEIVSLWKKRATPTQPSELTPILHDIQELSASFSSFSIVHARRTTNNAAHACAKAAASSEFDV